MVSLVPGYEDIRCEVVNGRARITFHRPDSHNATTTRTLEELEDAMWERL